MDAVWISPDIFFTFHLLYSLDGNVHICIMMHDAVNRSARIVACNSILSAGTCEKLYMVKMFLVISYFGKKTV